MEIPAAVRKKDGWTGRGRKGLFPGLSKPFGRGCGRGMGLGDEMNGMDGGGWGVGRYNGDIMDIVVIP